MCDRRLFAKIGDERGIALVLTLFLMLALSTVAASIMFLSQTESYSTMNYRMMSQSRYGAESGLQMATNYLLYNYVPPSTGGADSIASYNTTVSPVTTVANGNPVILSANPAVASNYPVAAVQTAFATAFNGTKGQLAVGNMTVALTPFATLMSMEEVPAAKSVNGVPFTIQTWQITSDGTITAGARTAVVEVTAVVDTQKIASNSPALNFAAFATSATCGALDFSGGGNTNSYDSTAALVGGVPVLSNSNGNVGTNGNLTESGNATINGSLSTPAVGVGKCSNGNVDAETSSGKATVTGGIVHLPQAVNLVSPSIPTPNLGSPPKTKVSVNKTTMCTDLAPLGVPAANCSGSAGNLTITGPLTLGDVGVTGGAQLAITSGTYTLGDVTVDSKSSLALGGGTVNMNSITTSGTSSVTLGTGSYNTNDVKMTGGDTVALLPQSQVTITLIDTFTESGNSFLNIPADTGLANPSTLTLAVVDTATKKTIDFSGGSTSNASFDPSRFQILYGGTGDIKLSGNTTQASVIYAPNADVHLTGNSDFYGEAIASTLEEKGGGSIHYDRNLANKGLFSTVLYQSGNAMLSSFSWKKY